MCLQAGETESAQENTTLLSDGAWSAWFLQGSKAPAQAAMLAGVVAGVVEATTCMTPMHCIQIKIQQDATSSTPRFRGLTHAVRAILAEEGLVRGLYAGMGPTVLKQVVIFFLCASFFPEKNIVLVAVARLLFCCRGVEDAKTPQDLSAPLSLYPQAVNSCIRFTSMNELTRLRRESMGTSVVRTDVPLPTSDIFLLGACAGPHTQPETLNPKP
jgi:hypothetical protein